MVSKPSLETTHVVWRWKGQEIELEQRCQLLWGDIQLWEALKHWYKCEAPYEEIFIKGLEDLALARLQLMPVVIKNSIFIANAKRRLLQTCGSEDKEGERTNIMGP